MSFSVEYNDAMLSASRAASVQSDLSLQADHARRRERSQPGGGRHDDGDSKHIFSEPLRTRRAKDKSVKRPQRAVSHISTPLK